MWVSNDFIKSLEKSLESLANKSLGSELISLDEFKNDSKYGSIISSIYKIEKSQKEYIWETTESSNILLDLENGLNDLAQGKFSQSDMSVDQGKAKISFNKLIKALNALIDDSNDMNLAAREGKVDFRIDESKYTGDFAKIVKGINDAMAESQNIAITQDGVVKLNRDILGFDKLVEKLNFAISYICRFTNSSKGAIYIYNEEDENLTLSGSFAFVEMEELSNVYKLGEGVVGQVALEKQAIFLKNIKENEQIIVTGTTKTNALNSYTFPLIYQNNLIGVIEVASFEMFTSNQLEFFNKAVESLAGIISATQQFEITNRLLIQTQAQSEELEESSQQLKQQNEELEESRVELENQTKELEEQAIELEKSQKELEEQNSSLASAQEDVKRRALELEDSNKYKTDFLSNMSHELRTPLNSINILSKILSDNKTNNLDDKQLKQVNTIHQAGADLLGLINDLLDLSKIEAGMMSLNLADVHIGTLLTQIHSVFEPLAQEKDIDLILEIDKDIEKIIFSDKEKIRQIIKNFISNALKFTPKGKSITIGTTLNKKDTTLPISLYVKDEGIGIPDDKIEAIFKAFQQADGSTSRQFGGTGLGLSISKELAHLLGGDIELESKLEVGSVFSVILPLKIDTAKIDKNLVDIVNEEEVKDSQPLKNITKQRTVDLVDDRDNLEKDDNVILIIEDDEKFASIIRDEVNSVGSKAIIAINGNEGIELAIKYQPLGIILDMNLPIMDGWEVIKHLKQNMKTRHIPVKIISGDEPNQAIKRMGAVDFIQKPIEAKQLDNIITKLIKKAKKEIKDLLIVEDNETLREHLKDIIGEKNSDLNITTVSDAKQSIEAVKIKEYDCAIVDIGLPDMDGFKLLEIIKRYDCNLPIIVYSGRDFTASELKTLREYSESIILKTVESEARLLDETMLFLHRLHKDLTVKQKKLLQKSLDDEIRFVDKKILIVDDDMRNIFSMSSLLENHGLEVVVAYDGREAIETLKSDDGIDMVLMDIMMPVMDGYEAIQTLRKDKKYATLPIVALTAKSQKGERKKCIDIGASDYMSKPIDSEQLIQLIKIWLDKV